MTDDGRFPLSGLLSGHTGREVLLRGGKEVTGHREKQACGWRGEEHVKTRVAVGEVL